jgi:opacity protein-like surface antigen
MKHQPGKAPTLLNGTHKAVLLAILMIGVATPANSQSNKKYEVFGTVGVIPYADDVTAVDYGGGFGIRPYATRPTWMRGWEFEFNLTVTPPPQSYYDPQTRYTANVLYHFLSGRVQPYALIGVGGWYEPGDSSPPIGAGYTSQHQFLANAGGGLRIVISDRWSIRPEFRGFDLRDDENNFARYGVYFGYHF